MSSLVEYVAMAGLDVSTGLEAEEERRKASTLSKTSSSSDILETSMESSPSPLATSFKAKLLQMLPHTSSTWPDLNPDVVAKLMLPQGLRFSTDVEEIQTHSFVVTREDGDKKCGVAILFSEPVDNSDVIQAINTLQAMHIASDDNNNNSVNKADDENDESHGEKENFNDGTTTTCGRNKQRVLNNSRSRSLPRHYQQMRFKQFDIDTNNRTKSSNKRGSVMDRRRFDFKAETLYVSKAVALILNHPFINVAKKVLLELHNYIQRQDADVKTLESLISWLLFELCTPPPGRSLKLSFLEVSMTISMPKTPRELPLFDYSLMDFFDLLGVDNAIKLIVCVLLEHQVVVYSRSLNNLMLVCECTTALLYPFNWPHVYVPILPPNLEHFLDAPVPFIMGLVRRCHDVELSKRGTMCIVDIDNGELELPEELPLMPFEEEIADYVREYIIKFGGKEGASMMMEHAIESRDMLESSMNDEQEVQQAADADSLQTLNEVIARIERISSANSSQTHHHDKTKASMRVNTALREVFANHMCHLMMGFEDFVISDDDGLLLTPQQQETAQNFDRTSFLTDQPRATLPFLSRFVESQMFSSFIDEVIARKKSEENEKTPFDGRCESLKDRLGDAMAHFSSYDKCDSLIERSDKLLCHRLKKIESHVGPPKKDNFGYATLINQDESPKSSMNWMKGVFPILDPKRFVYNGRPSKTKRLWTKDSSKSQSLDQNQSITGSPKSSTKSSSKLSMLNAYNTRAIAKTNYDFVQQLLNECRQKTKRILVEKLGSEASNWGHSNSTHEDYKGVEESILVYSVSDLIERIFGHGLSNRSGKSSLWQFIYKAGRSREKSIRFKNALGRHAFIDAFIRSKPVLLNDKKNKTQVLLLSSNTNEDANEEAEELEPLAMAHNVATMHDIKTDIGFARAWIRLALERKQLSHYLLCLVRDSSLLRSMYKRYAFVRSEEEREQAFHYMQTLNTVDFSCFTNAYPEAKMLYQVLLFPSQRLGHALSSPAGLWLQLFGHHGHGELIEVPDGVIHFSFWSLNVGQVTSLRIGIAIGNETLIEHVLIRNEFTRKVHIFPCGRWLGKTVDDNSTERCLFNNDYEHGGEGANNVAKLLKQCMMPPNCCWPPLPMRMSEPQTQVVDLQTMLGDSVNRIVKYHHRSLPEKISPTLLMCGTNGLVHALLNVFSFGFKSARLFSRNLCVWDFLLKITMDFNQSLGSLLATNSPPASPQPSPRRDANPRRNLSVGNLIDSPKRRISDTPMATTNMSTSTTTTLRSQVSNVAMTGTLSRANQFRRMYTKLITRIETTCDSLGKDDKFELFVCLAAYDRLLGKIVTDLAKAIAAQQLYEEYSFLRTPSLMSFLSELLRSLDEVSIPVDPALTMALEKSL